MSRRELRMPFYFKSCACEKGTVHHPPSGCRPPDLSGACCCCLSRALTSFLCPSHARPQHEGREEGSVLRGSHKFCDVDLLQWAAPEGYMLYMGKDKFENEVAVTLNATPNALPCGQSMSAMHCNSCKRLHRPGSTELRNGGGLVKTACFLLH